MGAYLGHIQTIAMRMSINSLADLMLQGMQSQKMLEKPSMPTGFNEASIDTVIQIVIRAASARFIYPRVALVFSLYNVSIGVVHLGIGFAERFKTQETPSQNPEKWNTIALNIHKGFCHLLAASYDFGIGFLLLKRYTELVGVIAFAVFPVYTFAYHRAVFKKPEAFPIPAPEMPKFSTVGALMNVVSAEVLEKLKTAFPGEEASPPPPSQPAPPPPNVVPKYLDSTCYTYIVAKKITLELMPDIAPPPERNFAMKIVQNTYDAGRRLSGFGVAHAPPLPEYGL